MTKNSSKEKSQNKEQTSFTLIRTKKSSQNNEQSTNLTKCGIDAILRSPLRGRNVWETYDGISKIKPTEDGTLIFTASQLRLMFTLLGGLYHKVTDGSLDDYIKEMERDIIEKGEKRSWFNSESSVFFTPRELIGVDKGTEYYQTWANLEYFQRAKITFKFDVTRGNQRKREFIEITQQPIIVGEGVHRYFKRETLKDDKGRLREKFIEVDESGNELTQEKKIDTIAVQFHDGFLYRIKSFFDKFPPIKEFNRKWKLFGDDSPVFTELLLLLTDVYGIRVKNTEKAVKAKRKELKDSDLKEEEVLSILQKVEKKELTVPINRSTIFNRLGGKESGLLYKYFKREYDDEGKLKYINLRVKLWEQDINKYAQQLKEIGIISEFESVKSIIPKDQKYNFVLCKEWVNRK